MGAYSRKDMIEFAKFAKSWSTPRNVEKAYKQYLKGKRLTKPKETVSGRGQHADWEAELEKRR
jgi:hypothetical protein